MAYVLIVVVGTYFMSNTLSSIALRCLACGAFGVKDNLWGFLLYVPESMVLVIDLRQLLQKRALPMARIVSLPFEGT